MTSIVYWLLQTSVLTAAAIPIVALVCRFFPRRPAIQHALWAVVLIKFVTPIVLVWPWPVLNILDSTSLHIPDWLRPAGTASDVGHSRLERAAQGGPYLNVESWIHSGSTPRVLAAVFALL